MSSVGVSKGGLSSRAIASEGIGTLWGADLLALHDRWWAMRGVQVVRCAGRSPDPSPKGPRVFLLLNAHDMVRFDAGPALKRMTWLGTKAVRVRLVDRDERSYSERVRTDREGQFLGVSRVYHSAMRATTRAALTGDIALARVWRSAPDRYLGWAAVSERLGPEGAAPAVAPSLILDARSEEQRTVYARVLLRDWATPGYAFEGVYEFKRGVWIHESVEVPPDARLVGPLWIGAGTRIAPGQTLVGPGMVRDDASASPALGEVDWAEAISRGTLARTPRGFTWKRRSVKRLFDIVFSVCVLAATAPLYPLIMLAIFIEDGWPPFFAHRRQTLRGREFPCMKFRTMRKNAESLKLELSKMNQADGPQFFIQNDPRVLRVGKVLRKFQLDELPQFINVLLGHMSVVGPRPSPDGENQFCPAWREARLSVRPGVTGLWQVRRTRLPETDFQEWIRYDLEYVQKQSFRFDLWIIWTTIRQILKV